MNVVELVGRFHPLFVHLPIGILLLGVVFEWLSLHPKFKNLQPSIPIILLIGAVAALFSCVTGYLLSQSGEYDTSAVSWHQWMGVALMVISFGYWWAHQNVINLLFRKIISILVFVLINLTGHLGGSLTHGEDYLTESLSAKETTTDFSKINLAEAKLYEDLVKPILSQRCYTCHSTAKQKGKLRLDDKESLLKGGKHGVVLVANKVDESEIILRLLLPLDEKDHMPPKEKSQLTSTEIEILKLWIVSGADFEKTVTKLGQVEELQSIVKIQVTPTPDVPFEPYSTYKTKFR